MSQEKNTLKYLDLFSGIGGFHEAMIRYAPSAKCIAAVEFEKNAARVYENTYGIKPLGDIKEEKTIEELDRLIKENDGFDILFAGFPCQSFSKAGKQKGFEDETRGTLFFDIEKILKKYQPKYFILENVRNLVGHTSKEGVKTMDVIGKHLRKIGYSFKTSILSPHKIVTKSIPHLRERIFIYGVLEEKCDNAEVVIEKIKKNIEDEFSTAHFEKFKYRKNINFYLDHEIKMKTPIAADKKEILDIWEELNNEIEGQLISPIWLDVIYNKELQTSPLKWKQKLIDKTLLFYDANKEKIDQWYIKYDELKKFPKSFRKFEWNANSSIKSIFDGIIQFRPSGIRVKKPDYFPTFVAINQTPIIGWERRYITPHEIQKLFGFQTLKLGNNDAESYKQLGNSVSVDVVEIILKHLVG